MTTTPQVLRNVRPMGDAADAIGRHSCNGTRARLGRLRSSGQVLGASVHGGSGSFQSCISGRTRSIHFPSFSAPRMGARYSFSVD